MDIPCVSCTALSDLSVAAASTFLLLNERTRRSTKKWRLPFFCAFTKEELTRMGFSQSPWQYDKTSTSPVHMKQEGALFVKKKIKESTETKKKTCRDNRLPKHWTHPLRLDQRHRRRRRLKTRRSYPCAASSRSRRTTSVQERMLIRLYFVIFLCRTVATTGNTCNACCIDCTSTRIRQ